MRREVVAVEYVVVSRGKPVGKPYRDRDEAAQHAKRIRGQVRARTPQRGTDAQGSEAAAR